MKKQITLTILFLALLCSLASADPIIASISDKTVNEGQTIDFDVTCSSPDDGSSEFLLLEGPGTLTKSDDTKAVYSYSPDYDTVDETDDFEINISVSDGNSTDTESFTLSVADVNPNPVVTLSDVTISGKRAQNHTRDVTIKNEGKYDLTDINIEALNDDSKYKVLISSIPDSLDAGESATFKVQAYIPIDMDAVDENARTYTPTIATLKITGTSDYDNSDYESTGNLLMQAENLLTFSDIETVYDGDDEDWDVEREVSPGSKLEVNMIVENEFDDDGDCDEESENCDMEDIEVEFDPDDNDLDFEDNTISFSDVDANEESDEETATCEIESDIDDGDYDIVVMLTGEDENGARHGERKIIELDVEKAKHEITIMDVDVQSSVQCYENSIVAKVNVENTGKNDEDDVLVYMYCSLIDYEDEQMIDELEEGDDHTYSFIIDTSDKSVSTVACNVKSFYDRDEDSDSEMFTFQMRSCEDDSDDDDDSSEEEEEEEEADDDNVEVIEYQPPEDVVYGQPIEDEEESFMESKAYVILLVMAVIIVILLIGILLMVLAKK